MWHLLWLRNRRNRPARRLAPYRPRVELLECRCLPSTVINLDNAGPGSLRDAIAVTPPGGTVDFQADLAGTIVLTTGELAITKDLTIAGPGADVITVSGNHASRVFNIGPAFTVGISGLTIADGRETNADGGGIRNFATLTISNSTLSGNSAVNGGGIRNQGTLTITNSTLGGNSAVEGSIVDGRAGGGIFNNGSTTISNSTLSGNTATVYAGGIFNDSGTLTVTNSILSGNSAGNGGGILNGGTLIVTNSTLSGNSATAGGSGGGILNYSNGTLTMTNSTVR
jgi:hypothetical protein